MTTYRADLEHRRSRRRKGRKHTFLSTGLLFLISAGIAGYFYWTYLFQDLPSLPPDDQLWSVGREPAIEFRATDGRLLLQRGPRYGRAVTVDELPPFVVQAFIAGEDKRYYDHNGMDLSAVFRAMVANFKAGRTVQGGSTLTQQLIKNLLLSPDQSIKRKAQEMRLAMTLETRLDKDDILALYLNRIYLGKRAYGIDGAAEAYFRKLASELTLAEASFIAALPKAPTRFTNEEDLKAARLRQKYILSQMVSEGYISAEEAETAADAPISFSPPEPEDPRLGYAADFVTKQMQAQLPQIPADAIVTITLLPEIQSVADEALKAELKAYGTSSKAGNAAAMVMDTNGRILAMVGGQDYLTSKFNRTTMAMRQPGSSFKAFVYATAMEKGLTPETVRVDSRTYVAPGWAPRNYSNTYHGPVHLKDAFAHSLNTVAAKLTQEVGARNVVNMAHKLGIGTSLLAVPSIALGSDETTLFDMTRAYGAFARQGKRLDPYIIERVTDSRGNLIYERKPYPASTVLSPRAAQYMDELLQRVVETGSGWRADIDGMKVAGKTGTSQEWRDAWFIGYVPGYIAGIWVGNDDNTPMNRITGGSIPASAWHQMMVDILGKTEDETNAEAEVPHLSEKAQQRVEFFSELSNAFATNLPITIATLDPEDQGQ